mgnify:CR=1 FL=1
MNTKSFLVVFFVLVIESDIHLINAEKFCIEPKVSTILCEGTNYKCGDCDLPVPGVEPGFDSGVISDGQWGYYEPHITCTWTIESTGIIDFSFTTFSTSLYDDYVTVRKCTDQTCTQSIQLGRHSGSMNLIVDREKMTGYLTDSTYRFLQIEFVTIASTYQYLGFNSVWNSVQPYCDPCLPNSVSPVGNIPGIECECKPGYTGPIGGTCTECPSGKYKSIHGSAVCSNCVSTNSFSKNGSIHISNCKCNPGYVETVGGQCTACKEGTYRKFEKECIVCGSPQPYYFKYYQFLIDARQWGVCSRLRQIKLYDSEGTSVYPDLVVPYGAGIVFASGGSATDYIYSPEVNGCRISFSFDEYTDIKSYKIKLGWTGYNSDMRPIQVQLYASLNPLLNADSKMDWNSDSLLLHVESSMFPQGTPTGSEFEFTNLLEPYNSPLFIGRSTSPTKSISTLDCVCFQGTTGINGKCDQCAAGQYKNQVGTSPCVSCDPGTYSEQPLASVSCTNCPLHTTSLAESSSVTQCVCKPGTFGDHNGCDLCVAGSYKTNSSIYSPPDPRCGVSLICPPCPLCTIGKYSTSIGSSSESSCQNCLAGKYSEVLGAPVESACKKCEAGKYQDKTGKSVCVICQRGKYTTSPGTITCEKCEAGKYSTATGATNANTCQQCSTGKYRIETGGTSANSCTKCGNGKYSTNTGATLENTCQHCESGKYSTATGAFLENTCQNCHVGKYQIETGKSVCVQCAKGKYSTIIGSFSESTCEDCRAGKYSAAIGAASESTCADCVAGKYSDVLGSTVCVSCVTGKYSERIGTIGNICQDCPVNTYSPESSTNINSCECNANFFGSTPETCEGCPLNSISVKNSKYIAACKCKANFYGLDIDNKCVECSENSYSIVGSERCNCNANFYGSVNYESTSNNVDCKQCPSKSTSLKGSSKIQDCKCNTGVEFLGMTNTFTCNSCKIGYYKNTIENIKCQTCPSFSTSVQTGSTSISACICVAGYTFINGGCQACTAGTYKVEIGDFPCTECEIGKYGKITNAFSEQSACIKCPVHTNSVIGSSKCTCNTGYEMINKEEFTCRDCDDNQYKDTDTGKCINCQGTSQSDGDGIDSCQCERGTTGTNIENCISCAEGSYKDNIGSALCTSCPANTISVQGSTDEDSCVCDIGYTNKNNLIGKLACECDSGYFGEDNTECTICPPNSKKELSGPGHCTLHESNTLNCLCR